MADQLNFIDNNIAIPDLRIITEMNPVQLSEYKKTLIVCLKVKDYGVHTYKVINKINSIDKKLSEEEEN